MLYLLDAGLMPAEGCVERCRFAIVAAALDLARSLMSISDEEAEALFHAIVSEAEAFFGESVHGA